MTIGIDRYLVDFGRKQYYGSRENVTTLVIHPPWCDPGILSRAEILHQDDSHRVDLNLAFRSHLASSGFLAEIQRNTLRELDEIEARQRLRGHEMWNLYRCVRLAAATKSLGASQATVRSEAFEEYFHSLGTGESWYFTGQLAYPHSVESGLNFARSESLGLIGGHFRKYVEGIGLPERAAEYSEVLISIDDNGQLAFGFLLARQLATHHLAGKSPIVIDLGPAVDRRLVRAFEIVNPSFRIRASGGDSDIQPRLSAAELGRVAKCSHQSGNRLLSVLWRPNRQTISTSTLERFVEKFIDRGISVALTCSPSVGADESDAKVNDFLFRVLDRIVSVQDSIASVRVDVRSRAVGTAPLAAELLRWSRDQNLSSLLEVQMRAELDNRSLVPQRLPRRLFDKRTRLVASPSLSVRSRFNLSEIFEHFDLGKASRPFRYGRGIPRALASVHRRAPRPDKYMIATGFPLAIPISKDNVTYSDAFSYFASPRSVASFVARYRAPDRVRVFGFLDDSVANGAFRVL